MNLSVYLKAFMEKRNLSKKEFTEQTKLNPAVVTRLTNKNDYTMFTVQRLVEVYGDEFKQFLEYRFCTVCGEMFIPNTKASVTCSDPECIHMNAYGNKHKGSGEAWERAVDKKWTPKQPTVSIGEFNGMAKKSNKSYGELQKEFLCKGLKC